MESHLMKSIGLVTRPHFESGIKQAHKLLTTLTKKGLTVQIIPHLASALKRPDLGVSMEQMQTDFIITLGGDGTLLFAARYLPPRIPLLPINLESFGFLAECEIEAALSLIDAAINDKLEVHETIRLTTEVKQRSYPDAANEVAIFPARQARPFPFKLCINNDPPIEFRADGFVIATPMGSTGHALSLGGPVIDSRLNAILLIPAAPLRQGFLPLVVPDENVIKVESGKPASLIIDGEAQEQIPQNHSIVVQKSKHPLRILRHPSSFCKRLQGKLLRC
jgi:NAD+ kinase